MGAKSVKSPKWLFITIVLIVGCYSPLFAQPNKSSVQIQLSDPDQPETGRLRIIEGTNTADTSLLLGPMVPPYTSCRIYSSVSTFGVINFMYRIIVEVSIDEIDFIRYDSTTRINASNGPNLQTLTVNNATFIRFIAKMDGGATADSAQGLFTVTFDDSPGNLTGK